MQYTIPVILSVEETEALIGLVEERLELYARTVRDAQANENVRVVQLYTDEATKLLQLRAKFARGLAAAE